MKTLGPAWWGGMIFGFFLGLFAVSLLVESSDILPTSAFWKYLRVGSALAATFTTIIGNWRRKAAEKGESASTVK